MKVKKKVKKSAAGTTEKRLLKALDAVEKAAVPKEMRDADGGFATEGDGDELQVSASEDAEPKGVKKGGRRRSSDEESDEEVNKADDEMSEESSDDEESSEESSDEESSPPMALSKKKGKGGKSTKKSVKKGKADSSSDDESSAETSDELSAEESIGESPKPVKKAKGKSVKKSHSGNTIKKALMADEGNAEVINASEFIEQLVDSVSDSNAQLTKSMRAAREEQMVFNKAMAEAITLLGNVNIEQRTQLRKLRKALENVPMVTRGKTLLHKGDVQEREFEQPEGADEMDEETYRKSMDALVQLATNGKIKAELVTEFEMTKSLDVLPPAVREMIQGSLH